MNTIQKASPPTPYRWTADEYRKIAEVGIFHEDDPVELLNGTIWQSGPMSPNRDGFFPKGATEFSPRPYRWTEEEYQELVDHGILSPDARVQLVNGAIYQMSPQGPSHALAIELTADQLRVRCPDDCFVTSQRPLVLGAPSKPEPDIAIVSGSRRDYAKEHPRSARLVVEVSDSSLGIDRSEKAVAYAQAGIPEYWIVNLVEEAVEVYREPVRSAYTKVGRFEKSDAVPFEDADPIPVASMLP